jgi:hypothetical protein
VKALASALQESGFDGSGSTSIWREMETLGVLRAASHVKSNKHFQVLKSLNLSDRQRKKAINLRKYDHFRYRGNELSAFIPDLQEVIKGMNTQKGNYGQGT